MVGVVASLGRLVPWEHQDHKEQADPGTKCTVRAHGQSLAAASRAAGGLLGVPHIPSLTFIVRWEDFLIPSVTGILQVHCQD